MTGVKRSEIPSSPNAEIIEAWDGPLYERFVRFRPIVTTGLGNHGEAALGLYPPQPGQRVLDVGCGFGDTTQRIAGLVGPDGEAVGVDVSPRFIEDCVRETAELGITNASFKVADVQTDDLGGPYDMAFSRMGVMFFNAPVPALRNVRSALVPGALIVAVVWRRRIDNDWMYRAQQIVEAIVPRPEEYDEPTCGPGPFSMADADTTTEIFKYAGFQDIALHRSDIPILVGRTVDDAIELARALGPAGELLRLAGDRAAHLHDEIDAKLREGLAEFERPDGIYAPASTWIVAARNPASASG
jgi:SAM-dependent methyltransferase